MRGGAKHDLVTTYTGSEQIFTIVPSPASAICNIRWCSSPHAWRCTSGSPLITLSWYVVKILPRTLIAPDGVEPSPARECIHMNYQCLTFTRESDTDTMMPSLERRVGLLAWTTLREVPVPEHQVWSTASPTRGTPLGRLTSAAQIMFVFRACASYTLNGNQRKNGWSSPLPKLRWPVPLPNDASLDDSLHLISD